MTTEKSQRSVIWLPASPKEGWASMDRYWREMGSLAVAEPLPNVSITCALPFRAPQVSTRAPRLSRALDKYVIYPIRVRNLRGEVAHILDHSYAHLLRYLPKPMKSVVTVFDLVPLLDATSLSEAQVERFRRTARCLSGATIAAAVSQQTAGDLVTYAGVNPERIEVVYPGTDVAGFGSQQPPFDGEKRIPANTKIVLSVGSTVGRKNLASLPVILEPLKARFQSGECCLVRAGDPLPQDLRERLTSMLGGRGFVEMGSVFGAALARLYQLAHVFLMPSTLEGFSFTMMEAMAAGAPVLTHRMSTNPEVGLDAVPYYEKDDHATATRLLSQLLTDEIARMEWSRKARQRAAELTWARHWEGIGDLYQRLLFSEI